MVKKKPNQSDNHYGPSSTKQAQAQALKNSPPKSNKVPKIQLNSNTLSNENAQMVAQDMSPIGGEAKPFVPPLNLIKVQNDVKDEEMVVNQESYQHS